MIAAARSSARQLGNDLEARWTIVWVKVKSALSA
jgi:hypothetical protein